MTTIKTLIGAVALIAASTGFAQSCNTCSWFPKGDDDQGVVGKRYAEAGFGVTEISHTAHNICDTGIGANIPIIRGLEIGGGYNYSWINVPYYSYDYATENYVRRSDDRITTHSAQGHARLYSVIADGIKPFISAGLERSWADLHGADGYHDAYNRTSWLVGAGIEFPYKFVSVTPTIAYKDDFKRSIESSQSFTYGVEVNSWITPRIGAYISLAYLDWLHTSYYNWVYGAGVRARF